MASVRSTSTPKPPEQLLSRRLNRSSASTGILPRRKLTLNKTSSFTISTITSSPPRQKPSQMSLKKGSVGALTSSTKLKPTISAIPKASIDLTIDKMSSATITELPSIKPTSKILDTTNISIPQVNSHTNKPVEEPQNDIIVTSSSSVKSSLSDNQFTLQSFDTVRTVGTGRNFA